MQRHLSTGAAVIAALLAADRSPTTADRSTEVLAPGQYALRLLAELGRTPRRQMAPLTGVDRVRCGPAIG